VFVQPLLQWKSISISYAECVSVSLVIQQAKYMLCILLASVACWAVQYFSILSHCTIFRKMLLNRKCVFLFSLKLLSAAFLILKRTEQDMIKNVYLCLCKVPIILAIF